MRAWEDVLDDLVRHRGGALVRYATLLTGDRREAEDLVQDALLKSFGSGRALRDELAAEAYARRAILTIFLDGTRRRRRWSGVAHLLVPDEQTPAGADATGWYAGEAHDISAFVHDLVVAAGGSISAEHGIGQLKRGELERLSSPARMTALRAIKRAFDPHELMNPGKLVTLAPEATTP